MTSTPEVCDTLGAFSVWFAKTPEGRVKYYGAALFCVLVMGFSSLYCCFSKRHKFQILGFFKKGRYQHARTYCCFITDANNQVSRTSFVLLAFCTVGVLLIFIAAATGLWGLLSSSEQRVFEGRSWSRTCYTSQGAGATGHLTNWKEVKGKRKSRQHG